jgi:hypothetical protein
MINQKIPEDNFYFNLSCNPALNYLAILFSNPVNPVLIHPEILLLNPEILFDFCFLLFAFCFNLSCDPVLNYPVILLKIL